MLQRFIPQGKGNLPYWPSPVIPKVTPEEENGKPDKEAVHAALAAMRKIAEPEPLIEKE